MKIGNKLSHPLNIIKWLRQGCCISFTHFKIYIRKALEEWKRKCYGIGIPLENITFYTLQFADDQVVLAEDKEDLEYMTRKLKYNYEKRGLDMKLNKTKYLCTGEHTKIWNYMKKMKLNFVKNISI